MTQKIERRTLLIAAVLIILGTLTAITGWYIFPVCEMEGKYVETKSGKLLPMPCGYTARAETAIGALVILAGVTLIALPKRDARRALGIMVIGIAVAAALIATVIIGMCAAPTHTCRIATQPALIFLSGITIITGIYMIITRDGTSS